MTDNATVVMEDLRNTGGDKYETTAREIQICRFSTFCSKWRMTFRKVTPAALKVNVKKFWQVLLVPWHVWAPIWVHFAPWWSIFPVKNRFSHIFPAPEGSPYQSLFLRYEIEKGLRAEMWKFNFLGGWGHLLRTFSQKISVVNLFNPTYEINLHACVKIACLLHLYFSLNMPIDQIHRLKMLA